MNAAEIIALAQAGAEILSVVMKNISTGKTTLEAKDLATLRGILDPLHAQNMTASDRLDAMLAQAEKE